MGVDLKLTPTEFDILKYFTASVNFLDSSLVFSSIVHYTLVFRVVSAFCCCCRKTVGVVQ